MKEAGQRFGGSEPGAEVDGDQDVSAMVIMKREAGVLLAVPVGCLPQSMVDAGNQGEVESLFGPSVVVTVPGVVLDGGSLVGGRSCDHLRCRRRPFGLALCGWTGDGSYSMDFRASRWNKGKLLLCGRRFVPKPFKEDGSLFLHGEYPQLAPYTSRVMCHV